MQLPSAIERGELPVADVDASVERILEIAGPVAPRPVSRPRQVRVPSRLDRGDNVRAREAAGCQLVAVEHAACGCLVEHREQPVVQVGPEGASLHLGLEGHHPEKRGGYRAADQQGDQPSRQITCVHQRDEEDAGTMPRPGDGRV